MAALTFSSPTISPQPAFHGPPPPLSSTGTLRRPLPPPPPPPPSQSPLLTASSSRRLDATSPTVASADLQSTREPAPAARPARVNASTQYTPPGYPPTVRWPRPPPASLNDSRLPSGSTLQHPRSINKRREPEEVKESSLRPDRPTPHQQLSSASAPAVESEPAPSASSSSSPSKRIRPDARMAKGVPRNYAECDVTDLGVLISDMLMDLVEINDKIPLKDGSLTRFHSRAPPGISIKDYLNRLIVHATLSQPILLSMVYYMDRLCALYPGFTISSLTVHRFLIAAATVAAKGLSDSFWTNNTYARVGGVSVKELALLELDFLEKMGWRIVPQPEVLGDYYKSLVERNYKYKFLEN